MGRRGLGFVITIFVVLAMMVGQLGWTRPDALDGRGSDESSLSAYEGRSDAVLPGERDRARLTLTWRIALPEDALARGEVLILTRWQSLERERREHPERRASRLHRPRMFAGDDRPPRAMTNT